MKVGPNAIPGAAGGEGGHRAAKPHGVIHRYVFYQEKCYVSSFLARSVAVAHDATSIASF